MSARHGDNCNCGACPLITDHAFVLPEGRGDTCAYWIVTNELGSLVSKYCGHKQSRHARTTAGSKVFIDRVEFEETPSDSAMAKVRLEMNMDVKSAWRFIEEARRGFAVISVKRAATVQDLK